MLETRKHAGIVQYTLKSEPTLVRLLANHVVLVLLLAWNWRLGLQGWTACAAHVLLLLWIWVLSRSLISGMSFSSYSCAY